MPTPTERTDDRLAGGTVSVAPARLRTLLADERVAFLLMGAMNTAFAFAVFASLQLTLGQHVHYLVVLLLTHVIGVLEAFTVYRLRVFRVSGNLLIDLARFESVNLVALGINVALLPLLVEVGHLSVILAQVVVLCVVTAGTYLGHKYFSFRRTADSTVDTAVDAMADPA